MTSENWIIYLQQIKKTMNNMKKIGIDKKMNT